MARIERVSAQDAGEDIALTLQYARAGFAELTGRTTANMVEPIEVYAHVPSLLKGILALAQASGGLQGLPRRYQALIQLKTATLNHCEYCIDLGSQVSRHGGLLSDEEMLALPFYRTRDLFTDVDKLVLDYAAAMTRTPVEVSDELFEALREHFDEGQLVELTHGIALENMYSRFNLALGIGSSGLSEGMVCAVPVAV